MPYSTFRVPHSKFKIGGRLSLLYFLQFAVWGCYLTCFGQLLGSHGLGSEIAWFYSAIGLVSLFTPAFLGQVADRTARPERLLWVCHAAAAAVMFFAWRYAVSHQQLEFAVFFPLYILFLTFYMPTMALANTTSFSLLRDSGLRPIDVFPGIRVWGTVGFVCSMWMVNSMYWHDGMLGITFSDMHPMARFRFQFTPMQLFCTSLMGILTALYCVTLPEGGVARKDIRGASDALVMWRKARVYMRMPHVRTFLIFAMFGGVCLQISNGFATPFISHFAGIGKYAGSMAAGNATMLFSLSQITEAACLFLVGGAVKRFGFRGVFTLAFLAWGFRFLFFALGNPGPGLWMLIASMAVYGIGFDFLTVAGQMFVEQNSDSATRGFGQGVMMLVSNGIGATAGVLAAGEVVNLWCGWQMVPAPSGSGMMRLFMGEWVWPWGIFAAYAFALAALYFIFSRRNGTGQNLDARR